MANDLGFLKVWANANKNNQPTKRSLSEFLNEYDVELSLKDSSTEDVNNTSDTKPQLGVSQEEKQEPQQETSTNKDGFFSWLGKQAMAGLGQFNKGVTATLDFILPTEFLGFGNSIPWFSSSFQLVETYHLSFYFSVQFQSCFRQFRVFTSQP